MDMINFDTWLFYLINHDSANGLFDVLMPVLSNRGYLLALPFGAYIIILAFRQASDKRRETVLLAVWTILIAVVSFLLADWITNEIKYVFKRIRPCNALEGVRLLGGCTQTYSMPSGHSTNSFAYAIPLFFMTRGYVRLSWRLYPLVLAGLVAYSRVYLGVHYPWDVTAGAIVGGLSAVSVMTLFRFASERYKVRPYTILLFGSLISTAIFKIYHILRGPIDLSPYEAFCWQLSGSPAPAVMPDGPMVVWLIMISTSVFGDTVFSIRIFAATLSTLSCYLMFRLVRDIYHDEAVALWAALLLLVIPAFSLAGVMFTNYSALIFFWILSLYLFYRAIQPEADARRYKKDQPLIWIYLGISIGLGLLTSYMMALFCAGMLIFLLMSDKRFLLKTVGPYVSFVISLCPVLIWIAINGFAGTGEVKLPDEAAGFWGTDLIRLLWQQILLITPIILALIFFALHNLYYKDRGFRSTYLFAFSIPVIILSFFAYIMGGHKPGLSITGYLTGIIAIAFFFFKSDGVKELTSRIRMLRGALIWAAVAIALFVTVISHFPNMIKLSAKMDPAIEFRGWRELGSEVSALYRYNKANGPVLIISDRCGISSELAFYVTGHPTTYCINAAGQYVALRGMKMDTERLQKEATSTTNATNAIVVTEGDSDMPSAINKACDRVEKKILTVRHKGHELKAYSLFICYNFRAPQTGPIERSWEQL
jgi:undecaprenyl-diphosphatase